MKKEKFKPLKIEILYLEESDIITGSVGNNDQADVTGEWKTDVWGSYWNIQIID